FRQLERAHSGDGARIRAAVLDIVATRGKMQNPETGSGGMLVGVVDEVGPASPLGLAVGQRVATLVSLTLTPLAISDGLAGWDGRGEQGRAAGHAILFGRWIAAELPDDLPVPLALAVLDVCGAPALTARVVSRYAALPGTPGPADPLDSANRPPAILGAGVPRDASGAGISPAAPGAGVSGGEGPLGGWGAGGPRGGSGAGARRGSAPAVTVIGGGGKSGALALAAARRAGAGRCVGVVPHEREAAALRVAGL